MRGRVRGNLVLVTRGGVAARTMSSTGVVFDHRQLVKLRDRVVARPEVRIVHHEVARAALDLLPVLHPVRGSLVRETRELLPRMFTCEREITFAATRSHVVVRPVHLRKELDARR